MQELFFVLTFVIGLGLLSIGMITMAIKINDNILKEENEELEEMRMLLSYIHLATPAERLRLVFMMGGITLMSIGIVLIDFPTKIFDQIVKK